MSVITKKNLTEKEIDRLVIAQADDDSAWDKPIHIRKAKPESLSIPPGLAPCRVSHPVTSNQKYGRMAKAGH